MRSGLPLTLGAVGLLAAAATVRRYGSASSYDRAGHWGRAGAGVLLTTGEKVLVLLRSGDVTEPGTWGLPGGAVDPGEDALRAGLRELGEETEIEIDPDGANVVGSTVWQSPHSSFRYTTSVVRVPSRMTKQRVQLNWENDAARWVDAAWLDAHRSDLHPGLRAALPELLPLAFGEKGSRATDPTQTSAFRRWFGESKVVDAAGRPLVVYHGSPDIRELVQKGFRKSALRGHSYFATDRYDMANSYADPHRAMGDYQQVEEGVVPLYLSIQNPMVIDGHGRVWRGTEPAVEQARAAGHDGLIIYNSEDWYHAPPKRKTKPTRANPYPNAGTVYVWFSPTQAKSAATAPLLSRTDRTPILGSGPNVGTWDPNDARLSYNRTPRPPTSFRDLAAWTTWARTEGVELRLVKTPSYAVEITDLFADTTGTGAGTRVMEALVKAADKAGMPLTLHPSSPRNVTFYDRFGFVVGRYGAMRRDPTRKKR